MMESAGPKKASTTPSHVPRRTLLRRALGAPLVPGALVSATNTQVQQLGSDGADALFSRPCGAPNELRMSIPAALANDVNAVVRTRQPCGQIAKPAIVAGLLAVMGDPLTPDERRQHDARSAPSHVEPEEACQPHAISLTTLPEDATGHCAVVAQGPWQDVNAVKRYLTALHSMLHLGGQ